MQTVDRNYLQDYLLSLEDTPIYSYFSDDVNPLYPVFEDSKGLDGVMGDHYFHRICRIGSGGFSRVYLGIYCLSSTQEE